jgi:predicted dithiol-disulfide oxidoreductase (DUF899 family)
MLRYRRENMSTSKHEIRFPGESKEYRIARDQLLEAEMRLRRDLESVASQRRALPLGGEILQDYLFEELTTDSTMPATTRLSHLFQDGKDSLIIYGFMYGPSMSQPCVSCTSILDALDGEAPHVSQRVNLAVVAKSPVDRIEQFARQRGWRHMRLLSSANCSYNRDYYGETPSGDQMPALNVFVRRGGKIYHSYCTEMLYAVSEPGQDGRHVDLIWPLWNLLDLTPEGRGEKWYPRLSYGS